MEHRQALSAQSIEKLQQTNEDERDTGQLEKLQHTNGDERDADQLEKLQHTNEDERDTDLLLEMRSTINGSSMHCIWVAMKYRTIGAGSNSPSKPELMTDTR